MLNLLVIVHILVAVLLIVLVLLQDSKGGAMGGMLGGGGGSNSLFGATGATSLAAKATRIMAIIFALTSIGLTTYTSGGGGSVTDAVISTVPAGVAGGAEVLGEPEEVKTELPGDPVEAGDAELVEPETIPGEDEDLDDSEASGDEE